MGAWGVAPFESDEGLQWGEGLLAAADRAAYLRSSIGRPSDGDRLDDTEGLHLVCAAEFLLALLGQPRPSFPHGWLDDGPAAELSEQALHRLRGVCLRRLPQVLDEACGYRRQWLDKSGQPLPAWEADVRDLIARLESL